jgi:hypothetical protein
MYRECKCLANNNKTISKETGFGLEMEISHRELRVLLLHEFHLGCRATKAASNICSTIGSDVISIPIAQHWINRAKNGNFELDNSPGCEMDIYILNQLIEEEARSITRYPIE